MVIAPASPKRQRLEARISPEQKALFERAAALSGQTLTAFVVDRLQTAAEETIRTHEVIKLTPEASIQFVEALLDPPEPNERMRAAAERYRRFVGT